MRPGHTVSAAERQPGGQQDLTDGLTLTIVGVSVALASGDMARHPTTL